MGYVESQIFQVSGMILRPDFYREWTSNREERRVHLGLEANLPTGLLLFGGEGSTVMLQLARALGNCSMRLQLIAICGRNKKLKRSLEELKTRNPLFVEGFTREVPEYMHLSDFLIGKPGPGSISEALHMGLPVIVEDNSWTLPQERYNAEWIRGKGYGIVLDNFREVEGAVRELITNDGLSVFAGRIASYKNRAAFEIPPILAEFLRKHTGYR